jgi:putative phosphoesterase
MKIAVLTDIHGNLSALRAVLSDIRKEGDIDHLFCLGDMIGIGPDTNEVLECLTSLSNISFVSGNHEEALLHIQNGRGCMQGHEQAYRHHQWIAQRLDENYVPFLRSLFRQMTVELEGCRALMTHYHTNHTGGFQPIDPNPDGEKLDRLYADSPYDLVCFGHHHPVHWFQTNRRTYVNPGALGCNERSVARYGLIQITGGVPVVHLREVEYDRKAFLQSYIDLDVPDREFIVKVFHGVNP